MDRVINYTDILLRVPPLFLLDVLMRLDYGTPYDNIKAYEDFVSPNDLAIKIFLLYLLKLIVCSLGKFAS
jgi:hypothetical protein